MLAVLAGCAGTKSHDSKNLTTNSQGRYIARDTSRTVDLTNPPSDAWDRIRRGFAIPNLNTELSQQWTDYYASHPESVQRMAERAGKYLYFIVDEINRRGLPTELALLPFVESAYNPTALSRAQASGLWQFVPATGQHFNLKQDWWRDERRDPIASTNAALDYLEKLFEMQGDWYLALASYNWGEGSVQRAMAKNEAAGQPTDYLSLSMPDETRNYVPKLQAIKNIIADPQRYAVALPPVGNTPYFVTVRKNSDIDLEIAAKLAEMPLDEFKALNPSFNRPVIRGDHAPTLLLPADRVEIFNANLTNYKGDLSAWKVYHSRRGDPTRPSPSASASARPSCAKPMTSARARRSRPASPCWCRATPAPAASRWPRWPRRRRAGFRAGKQQQGRATWPRDADASGPRLQRPPQRPHPQDPAGRHPVLAGQAVRHHGRRAARAQQPEGQRPEGGRPAARAGHQRPG